VERGGGAFVEALLDAYGGSIVQFLSAIELEVVVFLCAAHGVVKSGGSSKACFYCFNVEDI